ncbi:MAG: flavin reductase family protein [Granulosicoccus sp.]
MITYPHRAIDRNELDQMDKRQRANLINALSGYKSANLLGTINSKEQTNLALVSSVFHVGANPPLIGCLLRPHSVPRHSLENMMETECFTLSAVTKALFKQAHQTSARYPRDESEFTAVGLTPEFSDVVRAPYVQESPLKVGVSLIETQTLAVNKTVLVIGEIKEIRLADNLMTQDGHLNLSDGDLVAISGLDEYHLPASLGRLPYPKPSSVQLKSE